ncbi:mannosylglycerate hydrolase [Klebsiella oxytoca]|uniref:mannosylglycerate hydrolase n=1 Tax=Klebsiella oxytoca TaxID=571 RepID=UPI001CCDD51C|nr:mannosylglycerate hydrolase [Klebsiella oxytoca]MBZ7264909.1 mannosylglycerate hydrolase [Klebsiella oxytoca]MCW9547507.1 mannosylglycerate hydrolase [Klebsiella oxytoca]
MKSKTVHIYSHTHWDQEWYFTSSRSRIYLFNHIKKVIRILENNDDFPCYLMDAQSALIESYLQWAPEDRDILFKLIAEKRLLTGPWYTQTDQLVIHQESVVRNLYYGMKVAADAGNAMLLGYVPDCFGQGGNMPQLYRQFGIHHALFWRGIADNTLHETEFVWQGDNGDRVFAVQMPWGYHYGGLLDETPETMKAFLDGKMAPIEARSSRKHLLYPHGFDQAPVRENLPALVAQFNECDDTRHYQIGSPLAFVEALEKEAASDVRVLQGELTEAKHSRVHKSIFSCRADLKLLNNEIEALLVNTLEPVLAISRSLGNDYPARAIADIWKLMFYNAAHDSIGGCNSDDTNQDVFFRYKQARDLAVNLLELHTRLISIRIPREHDYTFTVFNPLTNTAAPQVTFEAWLPGIPFTLRDAQGKALPYVIDEQKELTDYVLNQTIRLNPGKAWHKPEQVWRTTLTVDCSKLPALGYTRWYLDFSADGESKPEVDDTSVIENAFYRIEVEENGLLAITHKTTGKRYTRQMLFVENGDDGDSYNYSPPRVDMFITSEGCLTQARRRKTALNQSLQLDYVLAVPGNLDERARGVTSGEMALNVNVTLQNDDMIRFIVDVENSVLSHRLCVHFATDIMANMSYADQLFGVVSRPVQLSNALRVWEAENWHEKPISIEPMQSYVNLHDDKHGFTLHTNGVREYEIIGDNFDTIALTLFRTFGFMGKENLLYRPGRASGESVVETPDAQLLGPLSFAFGWRLYSGAFDKAQHARVSKAFLTTFPVYQDSDFLNGRLRFCLSDEARTWPQQHSVLTLPSGAGDALASVVKCAEQGNGLIVRLYNPNLEAQATIPALEKARFVMLDEHTAMQERPFLKPNDVQTLYLEREK